MALAAAELGPTRTDYYLKDNSRLNAYAEKVVRSASVGVFRPDELTDFAERIDARKTLQTLPPGLSERDFVDTHLLTLLTECTTDKYAKAFTSSAQQYQQPWLELITEEAWAPDERTHYQPFKIILLDLGFSEEELNRAIREAREVEYDHQAGTTPAHLTTFGTDQEYLTDNWLGLQWQIFRAASPVAAHGVVRIKRRETLHTIWDRDLTALQIEENPDLISHVAEASLRVQMPGNQIVPSLQHRAIEWMPKMGADFGKMKGDLIKLTTQMTNNPSLTGRLVMEMAEQQGVEIGPVSIGLINSAMSRFGSPGYGLIGEALMVVAGMERVFIREQPNPVDRIRGHLRNWLASEIDSRLAARVIPIPSAS